MTGEAYFDGRGTETNYARAFEWFQKAAAQGEAVGELYLAFCYRDGKGTKPNPKLAAQRFRRSAEQWELQAQYHLSLCYSGGFGVKKDIVESYKWATLAASHNYTNATLVCSILRKEKRITPDQIARATKVAEEFAKTNNVVSPSVQPPEIMLPYPNRFGPD